MRSLGVVLVLAVAATFSFSWSGLGQDGEEKNSRAPLAGPVEVELPAGDVLIQYVESKNGMALLITSHDGKVEVQRARLGDGKVAVLFEASTKGFLTPKGMINAAGVTIEEASTYKCPIAKKEAWGEKRGEVYIRVPLKFEFE